MKTIEFTKYLNCADCRASGLYCPQHRIEVEKILEQTCWFGLNMFKVKCAECGCTENCDHNCCDDRPESKWFSEIDFLI